MENRSERFQRGSGFEYELTEETTKHTYRCKGWVVIDLSCSPGIRQLNHLGVKKFELVNSVLSVLSEMRSRACERRQESRERYAVVFKFDLDHAPFISSVEMTFDRGAQIRLNQ